MITIRQLDKKPEKKYYVPDIAKATGLSEGSVTGYFVNRKISTKNGLTIEQIEAVCRASKRSGERTGIHWDTVQEIRTRLKEECGIEIVVEGNQE